MNKDDYMSVIRTLQKSENLIVYGLGEAGENFERVCLYYGISVRTYVDSKREGKFYGHRISRLEELEDIQKGKKLDAVICAGPAFNIIKERIYSYFGDKKVTVYDGGELFTEFIIDSMDEVPFLTYYRKNQIKITEIIDNLADEFSKDVIHSYYEFLETKNAECLSGYWQYDQYFPAGIYKEQTGVFIDGGSYNGKNAKEMIEKNPLIEKVICYEPFQSCIPLIYENIDKWNIENKVEVHNSALYSKSGTLMLTENGTASAIASEGIEINCEKIDDLTDRNISFIKMDIEGMELEALKGAKNIIKRDAPFWAICIYHKPEDIVEIPTYIMSLGVDYSYYIRHHERNQTELVFYAVPQ